MRAVYGSGGVGLIGAAAFGVLAGEARLARKWVGAPTIEPPHADGLYGALPDRRTLRLVVLGDSSAAGLGVDDAAQTPGVLLAAGLSQAQRAAVSLLVLARSGARSPDLEAQVDAALAGEVPDVAVVLVGANDVTHRVRPSRSVRELEQAVRRLRAVGAAVVVGTCPDLGTVKPIAQPLRWVARQWSRQLAAAQTIAVVEAGGRTVSLGGLLGPEFHADPLLFGPDRFHPSAAGYARLAAALLPSVVAALQAVGPAPATGRERRRREVLPVAQAAVEAAEQAGTEVAGVQVRGVERGPRGRWARPLRRRPAPLPEPHAVSGPVPTSG